MINIHDAGDDPQMREAPLYTAGGATASARQFARTDRVGENVFFVFTKYKCGFIFFEVE